MNLLRKCLNPKPSTPMNLLWKCLEAELHLRMSRDISFCNWAYICTCHFRQGMMCVDPFCSVNDDWTSGLQLRLTGALGDSALNCLDPKP
jgi:hypothetical protein